MKVGFLSVGGQLQASTEIPKEVDGQFLWDLFLVTATEKFASEFGGALGSAVGKKLAELLFGGVRTPWEQEVTEQLKTVIQKLDEVLQQIEALREYVRQEHLRFWREEARSVFASYLTTLQSLFAQARQSGWDSVESTVRDQSVEFSKYSAAVRERKDEASGVSLGLPLYAAVEAAAIMNIFAFRLLEWDEMAQREKHGIVDAFTRWHMVLASRRDELNTLIDAETAYLNNYPKKAPVIDANLGSGESAMLDRSRGPASFLVAMEIKGGAEAPFEYVGAQDYLSYDIQDVRAFFAANGLQEWPWPYNFGFGLGNGPTALGVVTRRMIPELNARRDALAFKRRLVTEVVKTMASLEGGIARVQLIAGDAVLPAAYSYQRP